MAGARERRLLFCCRGSTQDGLGHVIRTRAVIDRLPADCHAELVVLGSDRCAAPLLDGLAIPWSIEADDAAVAERARALDPGIVMLDTMTLDAGVFDAVADGRVTVSLSPIFDHLDRVDLTFSRTRYAHDGSVPDAPNRRHGLQYAIVRGDCSRIDTETYERHLAESPMALAISMGGADAANRTLHVLEALRDVAAPMTFWVLLGEGYAHSYNALVEAVKRDHRHEVILAKTNQSMWRILRNCSLAILAGGVTTYEAAYAGLPSINLLDTESHSFLVQELVERGAALIGGAIDAGDGAALRAEVDRLERDRGRLLAMHRACQELIDGRGADRVLDEVFRHAAALSEVAAR
jgi:spore coat polysaccharide biosynthesis predicted glycosyltransferase SpsG